MSTDSLLDNMFPEIVWNAYKASLDSPEALLSVDNSVWSVKRFISTKNVRARGRLHVTELRPNCFLLNAEIISKSINVRGNHYMLFLFGDSPNVFILVDKSKNTDKIFSEYVIPNFDITNNKEIRINAMRVRKLAKNGSEQPIRLTLLVNNQTAGVDGLETITLTGSDVNRGIITLKDRQEVDLKAESIGPWTEIETNSLHFKMREGIRIKDLSDSTVQLLLKSLK